MDVTVASTLTRLEVLPKIASVKTGGKLHFIAAADRGKTVEVTDVSEKEIVAAVKKLGKSTEVTRFKGLGEISPAEFKQFIGPDMRLSQVEYAPKPDTTSIMGFYMGRNTPERRDYIMTNLVVPVED